MQQNYLNTKICPNCGSQIDVRYAVCPNCKAQQPVMYNNPQQQYGTPPPRVDDSRWLTALLLCLFAGGFGIHRFYTGDTVIGILQLLTLGGCGIWALIDLIMIITNDYRDSEGRRLK